MSLFAEPEPAVVTRSRGGWIGLVLVVLGLGGLVAVATVPAPYVIQQPGPVYDTLGEVEVAGDRVPLIQIPLEPTYPTAGSLDMLTVGYVGSRQNAPSWLDIIGAHFDPARAVIPVDLVYPPGVSFEDTSEQRRLDMDNSQREAVAAALTALGYEFDVTLTVAEVIAGGASAGQLQDGDVIVSVNGQSPPDVTGLRAEIAANGVNRPATVLILRGEEELEVQITPTMSEGQSPSPVFGILVASSYDFPFAVTIQLENVGGSSAGMMFALGIIDKLTPGPLNGGESVAGTGTISASGQVGAIGGIVQKMHGAVGAGADWFLAPAANCDEVAGNVPRGLHVFAVETLDDALVAMATLRSTGDGAGLPTCEG